MNSVPEQSGTDLPESRTRWPYVVTVLGAFLIVGFLVWVMHEYTQPAPLGQNRVAERAKALTELRAYEAEQLNNAGWVDPTKGLVRLRIEDAMNIVEQQWGKDPAAARSNLISRVEAANPPPPKPAPSPFE
jgi:hypothetical protein